MQQRIDLILKAFELIFGSDFFKGGTSQGDSITETVFGGETGA